MAQQFAVPSDRRASFFIRGHDALAYYRFGAVRDAAMSYCSYCCCASLLDRGEASVSSDAATSAAAQRIDQPIIVASYP